MYICASCQEALEKPRRAANRDNSNSHCYHLATGILGGVGKRGLVARVEDLVDEKFLDRLAVLERNKLSIGLETIVPKIIKRIREEGMLRFRREREREKQRHSAQAVWEAAEKKNLDKAYM